MTVKCNGKIVLSDFTCIHCGHKSIFLDMKSAWHCAKCGAKYKLMGHTINNLGNIECEYNMNGFNCIQGSYTNKCDNVCPAPYMYCKEHSDKEHLERAKRAVSDAAKRVEDAKSNYKLVEESRKTWMITELSGMDDE